MKTKKPYQISVDNIDKQLTRFHTRAFSHVDVQLPKYDLRSLKDSMVMIVSTHRSQLDYFLFGWVLYNNGLPYVRIAAGDNLTTLPVLGKRFRSYGAFSVKRDAGFKRNYVRDLCYQVVSMMENNEPILVFPEGGRSYRGNMMELKGGILLSAIIAQARNPDKKVILVPAAISYEHLPELPYFEMVKKGREMRKPGNGFFTRLIGSIFYFGADILAVGKLFVKVKFTTGKGDVHIDFGEPVAVNDIADVNALYQPSARDEVSGHQQSVRIISDRLFGIFTSLYRLLPEHIVATALCRAQTPVTKADLVAAVPAILSQCRDQKRNMKSLDNLTDELIVTIGIKQLLFVKSVSVNTSNVSIVKQSIIDYYAATLG
jgi:1-acyl-sn-glycerol-3-phosphate acyltransferase